MQAITGFFPISVSELEELELGDILLIGIPYEGKKETKPGSAKLPKKIRKYSKKFSGISATFNINALPFNCYDLGNLNIKKKNSEEIIKKMWELQKEKGFKVIALGGDHTITYYLLSKSSINPSERIIVIDAHADLAREYPSKVIKSHATTFYNLIDENIIDYHQLVLIGGHSFSQDVAEYNDINNKKMKFFSTESLISIQTKKRTLTELEELVNNTKSVYVSLDLDILSRAFVPAIDTAEFFGFTPADLLDVLQIVLKKAIYVDIVEGRYSLKDPKEQDTILSLLYEILSQFGKT